MKTRLDPYLNVLADVFGIGPLKLLYDKSLKDRVQSECKLDYDLPGQKKKKKKLDPW